jgi:hypothetical protein
MAPVPPDAYRRASFPHSVSPKTWSFPVLGLPPRQNLIRELPKLGATLAVAGAGSGAFALLGLPVPWISGSMLAVAFAAIFGAPMFIPRWLREIVFFFIGLNIGTAISPETIAGLATWPASILVLILALADSTDADVPRIAMVQAVRVAVLVAIVPPLISLTSGMDVTVAMPSPEIPTLGEGALLVGAGLGAAFLVRLTRFPAAGLMGALIASATLHATEVVSAGMPNWMLMIAFLVLGGSIGARFAGLGWVRLRAGLFDAAMTFVIGFVIALGTALLVTAWLGFPFGQTILAFSPGGFEVMVVMAFLLGVDAAYVGVHHTVRFVELVLLAPVFFRRKSPVEDDRKARDR